MRTSGRTSSSPAPGSTSDWPATMEGCGPERRRAAARGAERMTRRRGADQARPRRRGRDAAPARAPAPRRLVGRRAGVERDDDRRAPLLAARPRPARPRHRPPPRERPARPLSRRRHLVELVGGPGRPLDDDRVVRRAEDGRRRRRRRRRCDYIRREGGIPRSRVFTKCFIALLGQWPWQRVTPDPARDDPAAAERAVLDLQLRLLGAADGRPALRRLGAAAGQARRRRPARDRRAPRRDEAARRVPRAFAAARSPRRRRG